MDMPAHAFNPTWLIFVLAVLGPLLVFWRSTVTGDMLDRKIKELRLEREQAAEHLRVEIGVALKRAEDANSMGLFIQREIASYRERMASEVLKHEHLRLVEERFGAALGGVEDRLTTSIRELRTSVDGYTTALIGRPGRDGP